MTHKDDNGVWWVATDNNNTDSPAFWDPNERIWIFVRGEDRGKIAPQNGRPFFSADPIHKRLVDQALSRFPDEGITSEYDPDAAIVMWTEFWQEIAHSRWSWREALTVSNLIDRAAAGVLVAWYQNPAWGREWASATASFLPDGLQHQVVWDLPPPPVRGIWARRRAVDKWWRYWSDANFRTIRRLEAAPVPVVALTALAPLIIAANGEHSGWAHGWAPVLAPTMLVRGYAARLLDDLPSPPWLA